jgi:hypothetical protein
MATTAFINGSPVLNCSQDLKINESVYIGTQIYLKSSQQFTKNMMLVDVFRHPGAPTDIGERHKVVLQTCPFERIMVFDNIKSLGLIMKLAPSLNDSPQERFVWTLDQLDKKILAGMNSDIITFPKELGLPEDRYCPIVKRTVYNNQDVMEIRATIDLDGNGVSKDCLIGEMKPGGPVPLTVKEFMNCYKNREAVAIVEFPYLSCMNSGTRSVTLKCRVKQILLVAENPNKPSSGKGDNTTFQFTF